MSLKDAWHHVSTTKDSFITLKYPLCFICSSLPHSTPYTPTTYDQFTVSIVFPLPGCHTDRIYTMYPFQIDFFHFDICTEYSNMFLYGFIFHLLKLLNCLETLQLVHSPNLMLYWLFSLSCDYR